MTHPNREELAGRTWSDKYPDALTLCPECGDESPSVEAFEVFGVVLCAECAADLFDPGDGHPDEQQEWTDYDPDC